MAKKTVKKKRAIKKKATKKGAMGTSDSDQYRWLCEGCSNKGSWTTEMKAEAGANDHMAENDGHVATVEQK